MANINNELHLNSIQIENGGIHKWGIIKKTLLRAGVTEPAAPRIQHVGVMESRHFLPFFFPDTLPYLYKNTSASMHYFQNSSYRSSRSLSPTMSDPLFIPMFTGFLPSCAWSIKHPCVLAPLTSPAYLLVPEAKLRAHAGLMKQHALMAFSDGPERKGLRSRTPSRQRERCL